MRIKSAARPFPRYKISSLRETQSDAAMHQAKARYDPLVRAAMGDKKLGL